LIPNFEGMIASGWVKQFAKFGLDWLYGSVSPQNWRTITGEDRVSQWQPLEHVWDGCQVWYRPVVGEVISSRGVRYHRYSDDTQLYVWWSLRWSGYTGILYVDRNVKLWYLQNHLLLNADKCAAIMFGTDYQLSSASEMDCLSGAIFLNIIIVIIIIINLILRLMKILMLYFLICRNASIRYRFAVIKNHISHSTNLSLYCNSEAYVMWQNNANTVRPYFGR